MMKFLTTLLFLFSFYSNAEQNIISEVDLDHPISSFILKTKKIQIPGYPLAFNPSILKIDERYLLSFRIIPKKHYLKNNTQSVGESDIGVIFLDSDFEPIGEAMILKLNLKNSRVPSRSEDGRLLFVGEKIYLIYSDNQDEILSDAGFRIYVAELEIEGDEVRVLCTSPILNFKGANPARREKNWVPFEYQSKEGYSKLLFAYSLNPHHILSPLSSKNTAKTVAVTKTGLRWAFGEPRGGTPALLLDDEYLAFFHSSKMMSSIHSKGKTTLHYFMGIYTFSSTPPFEIRSVSEQPLFCHGFYKGKEYKPYWKPVQVVFPCGLVMDDYYIYVTYGRQDHEIWVMKLDKNGLKKSLKSVR